ncbi:hypothetical protein CPB85DRAFT_1313761 [Mucidula mucida]|nr:hypothetical protein CPB85DRAFT_1313761 [Mucidula mucida]
MVLFKLNFSPEETREVLRYFDCFVSDERDPDMQGFLVRLSAFIVNICLAILIKWSKGDLISPVGIVFLQFYTILLATFITMRNKDMSIPDSHFALVLTISPLSVYFTLLYRRLSRTYRIVVAVSTLIMLSMWIIMQVLIYFVGNHFFGDDDGKQCTHPSFRAWWFYRLVEFYIYVQWTYYLIPIFLALFIVYALRHVADIWREAKHRRLLVIKWRSARWIQLPCVFCWSITRSIWIVVTESHPWFIFLAITIIYLSWAGAIGLPFTSMAWYYWKEDLWAHTKGLPSWMWGGVVFFFTGKENPWDRVLQRRSTVENDEYLKVRLEMETRDEDLEGRTAVSERGLATEKVT